MHSEYNKIIDNLQADAKHRMERAFEAKFEVEDCLRGVKNTEVKEILEGQFAIFNARAKAYEAIMESCAKIPRFLADDCYVCHKSFEITSEKIKTPHGMRHSTCHRDDPKST